MNGSTNPHSHDTDLDQRIRVIKDGLDCRALFKRLWPDHYRESGNCLCPFHGDSDPSMQVTEEAAYCHSGCGKKDAIDLYREAHRIEFSEAVEALEKELAADNAPTCALRSRHSKEGQPDFDETLSAFCQSPLTQEARDYLGTRGIVRCPNMLEGRIGFSASGSNLTRQDALAFPITRWGQEAIAGIQFAPVDGSIKKNARGSDIREGFFVIGGNGPMVVTEGPFDALSIKEVLPEATVCAILGATNTPKLRDLAELPESPILFFDRDEEGQKATARAVQVLGGRCKVVDWSLAGTEHKDPNDLLKAGKAELIKEMIAGAALAQIEKAKTPETRKPPQGITASELMNREFPDPVWIVPGIIPEGLSILAGRPKTGKSWMALNFSVATALGTQALGEIKVDQGGVLYLALEDRPRRFKKRLETVLGKTPAPSDLTIFTDWPRLDRGGLPQLDEWCADHPNVKLVIVDTLAKVWPKSSSGRGQTLYNTDYAAVSSLKSIADKHGIAIIAVHHLRRSGSEDPLEQISGSMGISGSADTLLVLQRSRGTADATVLVTGRDVEEQELALRLEKEDMTWRMLGRAEAYKRSNQQVQVIELIRDASEPLSASRIAKLAGKSKQNMHKLLKRLERDGQVFRDPITKKYVLPGLLG